MRYYALLQFESRMVEKGVFKLNTTRPISRERGANKQMDYTLLLFFFLYVVSCIEWTMTSDGKQYWMYWASRRPFSIRCCCCCAADHNRKENKK